MPLVACPGCRQSFSVSPAANGSLRCPACNSIVRQSATENLGETIAHPPPTTNGEQILATLATRAGSSPPISITQRIAGPSDTVQVPGYEIVKELGRGGMGVVYLARQSALKRLVALKMILSGAHAGADELRRFRAEAEAAAKLQHGNIVQIHEVGEHDSRPYFSLEYIDGGSLDGKLRKGPLPPRHAAETIETLAHAMHHAHEQGIVHRDLKPANVLLTGDGQPKITDFGLAKKLDDAHGQTQSGSIMGTPSYLAPEQARGQSRSIGPAADIYALGAILYECITGRPPFRGATAMDTVLMVIEQEPVAPSRLAGRVPRDLETICLRCLRKEPEKRYASALSLAEDLRRFLDGQPIHARPIGLLERAVKWAKRKPAAAALLAVTVLAGAALLAGELYYNRALSNALGDAVEAREEAKDSAELARHNETLAKESEEQTRQANLNLRLPERVQALACSADGRTLATGGAGGTVRLWDLATGLERASLPGHTQDIVALTFAAGGRALVSGSADDKADFLVHAGEAILWDAAPLSTAGADRRYIEADETTAASRAVVVAEGALVHTSQLLPLDEQGNLAGKDKPADQVSKAFDNLATVLGEMRSDLDGLVKLNVVVAREEVAAAVTKELAWRLPKTVRPAVSFVTSPLPHPDALVGLDAVAITPDRGEQVRQRTSSAMKGQPGTVHASLLPAGARVYISGQAEKGDLPAATRKTLESLRETLKSLRLGDQHIVQVKSFLMPMSNVAVVEKEMAAFFGKDKTPPLVFVEWKAGKESPIEIELMAHAGKAYYSSPDVIDFLAAPKLPQSPIFSRVAKVHYGPAVYLSGIYAKKDASDAKAETADVLDQLKAVLAAAGSDLNHLAKATYYVASDGSSKALNELRPKYYDPKRPPAASKAIVAGVARLGRALTLDMIAVPAMKLPAAPAEVGHGLKREEAAEGWISLFDGQSAFGWTGGNAKKGQLLAGKTASEFGRCAVKADVAEGGTLRIAGKEVKVTPGAFALADTGGKGPIELGEGVKLRSLAIKPLGLKAISNGRNMDGWKRIDRATIPEDKRPVWKVENEAFVAVGGPGALQYQGGKYGDMVLQIDVKTRKRHANGGVFIRCITDDFMNGYELQVYNRCRDGDPSKPEFWATGGIDDRQNARRLVSRDFEYYRMTVIARGPHLATWINGYQVTDWTDTRKPDPNPRKGLRVEPGSLQLQAHDPFTDVEFKNVRIGE